MNVFARSHHWTCLTERVTVCEFAVSCWCVSPVRVESPSSTDYEDHRQPLFSLSYGKRVQWRRQGGGVQEAQTPPPIFQTKHKRMFKLH